MRIWSIHPKYLDTKGLIALWREALLAKHVLMGKTKGYKNHPQLSRFKDADNPLDAINYYLANIYQEAVDRGFNFSHDKVDFNFRNCSMNVSKGQIEFEMDHLLKKLKERNFSKYEIVKKEKNIESHPLFKEVEGDIAYWEKVN